MNITFDTITKTFTQILPEEKTCYICSSDKYVDDHHYDLEHGKISPETVPLCRRCHHTIGMYNGINMFDDDLLDRAIEVWNKTQALLNRPLITKDNIKRSKYWLKKHGIKEVKGAEEGKDSQTSPFPPFHFPSGEPLCGWQWVKEHMYDLIDYTPRVEITGPNINLAVDVVSLKDLKKVTKALSGIKVRKDGKRKTITLNPISKRFFEVE